MKGSPTMPCGRDLAPIVLFIYNRPDHTLKTLTALKENYLAKDSRLYVYADGPKNNAIDEEKARVLEARKIVLLEKWCKEVTLIESDINKGLAPSVIAGVSEIVSKYGKIIVLEDDLITSPWFLTYMNDALDLYENDDRAASIHGYVYPVKRKLPDYFFIRGADCWGWAAWKRSWDIFNPDGQFLLNEIKRKKLEKLFNFDNTYNYTGMLQSQIDGKVSSWAIRWYASAFLADKHTLYPGKSLVENIGMDSSGTHGDNTERYHSLVTDDAYKPVSLIDVKDSAMGRKIFTQYFKRSSPSGKNILYRVLKYFR